VHFVLPAGALKLLIFDAVRVSQAIYVQMNTVPGFIYGHVKIKTLAGCTPLMRARLRDRCRHIDDVPSFPSEQARFLIYVTRLVTIILKE
jgi:hypothetical protein